MSNRPGFPPLATGIAILLGTLSLHAGEPPTIDPFGQKSSKRDDGRMGVVELSDGSTLHGLIYLTRDKRFQVYDPLLKRQREIPLHAIRKIECSIKREWQEKEWRFKEGANDEKIYSGRSYPAREYLHTITLNDGRTITGPLSAIVYFDCVYQVWSCFFRGGKRLRFFQE